MLDVEQAIREVGSIYQALTGHRIEVGRSELPAEIDPRAHLENRYRQFKSMLASPQQAGAAPSSDQAWWPPLEVVQLDQEIRFELDLPGVARDQVSVAILGEWIVVRGRRGGMPAAGSVVRYSERGSGAFQRMIALPARARREGIHVALSGGVLAIAVPMDAAAAAAQPIEVK